MTNITQLIMAALAASAFALVYNIHGYRILLVGLGGAATWGVYLIAFGVSDSKSASCLFGTMFAMLLAEVMARLAKTPVVILLVPMLIPMVPGGDLFYMMSNIILGETQKASEYGRALAGEVGAIAFGIILVSTAIQIVVRAGQFVKKEGRLSLFKNDRH